jgi:hypothetical protein
MNLLETSGPVIGLLYFFTLDISRQVFEKYSDIKFHESPSSGSRVLSGRKERHCDSARVTFVNSQKHADACALAFSQVCGEPTLRVLSVWLLQGHRVRQSARSASH